MKSVVLIRHAQSAWNKQNRFTGWADPLLTDQGIIEAENAARLLADHNFIFDKAWASKLVRAIQTREIVLNKLGQTHVDRAEDWRLNERHYGLLQGKSKSEMAEVVGENQVWRWRRGFNDKADPMPQSNSDHPIHNPTYSEIPKNRLPDVESLADTRKRVMEFWRQEIQPELNAGKRLLISSHGNTLRALMMALSDMSIQDVEEFEIPTGIPIVYELDGNAKPSSWKYLGN